MASKSRLALPGWVQTWLIFTSVICAWDASFILMRPHSLPGGKYHTFWKPYSLYVQVDTRYASMTDTFVYAQSLLNVVEVVLNIFSLYLNKINSKSTSALAFTASVMTMWKTVLYMLQYFECVGGGEFHAHSDPRDIFLLLWLPNCIWILVPLLVMCRLWNRLVSSGKDGAKRQ